MPAWLNVPNLLTATRIALAPVFLWLYVGGREDGALIAFAVAASTDVLDGLAARLLGQQTRLGAFLDAGADKLLMACALLATAALGQTPWWLAAAVVGRDALLATGSLVLALRRAPVPVRPTRVGKYATALVALIVVVVLVADYHATASARTGNWVAGLSVVACLLIAWSAVQYAASFASSVKLGRRPSSDAGR